jgi:hypothetical protein
MSAKEFLDSKLTDLHSLQRVPTLLQEARRRSSELESAIQSHKSKAAKASGKVRAPLDDTIVSDLVRKHKAVIDRGDALGLELSQLLRERKELVEIHGYVSCVVHPDQATALPKGKSIEELLSLDPTAVKPVGSMPETLSRATALVREWRNDNIAQLAESLNAMGWPTRPAGPSDDKSLKAFCASCERIVRLQLSIHPQYEPASKHAQFYEDEELWLVDALVDPIAKRFTYHFSGARQTNQLGRPEWFLTYAVQQVAMHTPFLIGTVQPILDECSLFNYDLRSHFLRRVVALVRSKVGAVLPQVIEDELMLAHYVDEVIAFEKTMREIHGHGHAQPTSVLGLFYDEPSVLRRWLAIECKFGKEKLREQTLSPTWLNTIFLGEGGEPPATESAEQLMAFLDCVTVRFQWVSNPMHRLSFVHQVQLDLISDYYDELNDIGKLIMLKIDEEGVEPFDLKQLVGMMNSALYCANVLRSWAELPTFLELEYFQAKGAHMRADEIEIEQLASVTDSIFDEKIANFDALAATIQASLIGSVVGTFAGNLDGANRKERLWVHSSSFSQIVDQQPHEVSPELCHPLAGLREQLALLHELSHGSVFNKLWKQIASKLDSYIFTKVIGSMKSLSKSGAVQLEFDMQNLFSLFRPFTQRPENFLRKVKEATIVLTCTLVDDQGRPGITSIRKACGAATHELAFVETMAKLKVHGMTKEETGMLIALRLDVTKIL